MNDNCESRKKPQENGYYNFRYFEWDIEDLNLDISECKFLCYEENTGSLKKAIVKKGVADMSWMKHIFVPLENLQEVYLHPDQKDVTSHYLKIIHSENKCISVFNKAYFDIVD